LPTPKFLTLAEVLALHEDQIASFGGSLGIRDQGLLESALAQPQATFGGQLLHPTIYEQAAAYLYHIAMNHPFVDGNKRTAFSTMDTFLRSNNYSLILTDEEAYDLVLSVAQGNLNKDALCHYLVEVIVVQ
jgi:death on curing protein